MMVPTVHLNGTSAASLVEGYCNAAFGLRNAIDIICASAAPNARDFYVQGPDAYAKAAEEHRMRILKLREVLTELEQLAELVDLQGSR